MAQGYTYQFQVSTNPNLSISNLEQHQKEDPHENKIYGSNDPYQEPSVGFYKDNEPEDLAN